MRTEVAELLIDIEAQLRQLNLWDRTPPSKASLASTEPFCIDTLTLPQWLQLRQELGIYSRVFSTW